MAIPLPENEAERLQALDRYQILDTIPEQEFDDITELASFICGTPIAMIVLLDETRQWFKSKVGLDIQGTAREIAFCGHAIMQADMLIVPDALQDTRFANNPLVTGEPHIRFYAGSQLVTADGYQLGTLCVLDRVPRELSQQQLVALQRLARQVNAQLELRRVSTSLEQANKNQAALITRLEAANSQIKTLQGIIPMCVSCKNIRNDAGFWQQVEVYIKQNSQADFSHAICPTCAQKLYPDLYHTLSM